MLAPASVVKQQWMSPLDGVPIVRTLALVGAISGCSLYRNFAPFAELNRQGYTAAQWDFIGEHANDLRTELGVPPVPDSTLRKTLAIASSGHLDAVILPRMGYVGNDGRQVRKMLRTLREAGNVLIYEADDDLFSPWISRQQHAGIKAGLSFTQLEDERLSRIECLQHCDGATVSTQRLATVMREYVPLDFPIEVVPNLIDWRWWTQIKSCAKRWIPGPTVGWAGGGRPNDDLALIADAWGQIAKDYPDVTFVLQGCRPGPDGKPSLRATPWMAPILEHVPENRIAPLPFFDIKTYPVGMLNIDILCCPLVDRPFNRCKSNIKVLEGAAAGSLVLASPTVYAPVFAGDYSGQFGCVCETAEQWYVSLDWALKHPAASGEMAGRLALKVYREYNLQRSIARWPEAWASIVAQARRRKQRVIV